MSERTTPVILAEGVGVRLGGVSRALFEVAGRPLVDRCLDVVEEEGLGRPLVVTGHQAREVEAHVGSRADVVRNPWYAERTTFHGLRLAVDQAPQGRLLVIDCEVVVMPRVVRMAAAATPDLAVLVQPGSPPADAVKISMRGPRVTGISRDPQAGGSGTFIGISVLRPRARATFAMEADQASEAGQMDLDYEAVFDRMCARLDVRAIAVPEDAWAQIDGVSDVPGAEHLAARSDLAIAGD
jgi:choline kinase